MTAQLCPQIPAQFTSAQDRKIFFGDDDNILKNKWDPREQPKIGVPGKSCETELFFGFFFDGTRNNYEQADKGGTKNHSNIARLYDCFPGLSVPGVLPAETDWDYKLDRYSHFFRTYIPGVGSPFKQIRDAGTNPGGPSGGMGGAARIVWALVQAINNVHRYFHKTPLINNDEVYKLASKVELDRERLRQIKPGSAWNEFFKKKDDATQLAFEDLLKRLHATVTQHWFDKLLGRPPRIDPGIVRKINISIFGFSRGATQARAFANWLMALCERDATLHGRPGSKMTLGGFEVEFSFMGLLDTVASVGLANTMGNQFGLGAMDGHGSWADADSSLRIPDDIRTLHLVAAHETRRSFPLDSASIGGSLPTGCEEWVFPGMHSDVGGAYSPKEQGKGLSPSGSDMLARIPLIYMYRAARLAGVPLKLEFAKPIVKERFALEASTINVFNAYVAQCKTTSGTLTAIMREQRRIYIQWKLLRRARGNAPLESSASYLRASSFDQNDLRSANLEFESELAEFERWLGEKGKDFQARAQPAGFDNEHLSEWEEIATWWRTAPALAPELVTFFDDYVHDSRAWFKLLPTWAGGTPDNEAELRGVLKEWVGKRRAAELARKSNPRVSDGLTAEQREAADAFASSGKNETIPRMVNTGREPYAGAKAGYLRYRKVYAGSDNMLLSRTQPSDSENVAAAPPATTAEVANV
jgi:hypothetical protein